MRSRPEDENPNEIKSEKATADRLAKAIQDNDPEAVARIVDDFEVVDGQAFPKEQIFDLADIISEGKTAIELAAALGHWDCVRAIVEKRQGDPKEDRARYGVALLQLMKANNIDETRRNELALLLLAAGANPNQVDEEGNSCLHLAISRNRDWRFIEYLIISANADLTLENKEAKTPGELATAREDLWPDHYELRGSPSVLERIIDQKKGPKEPELHARIVDSFLKQLAARDNTVRMGGPNFWLIKKIINEKSIAKEWYDKDGNTLLHTAALINYEIAVKLLLSHNFSETAKNAAEQTPQETAAAASVYGMEKIFNDFHAWRDRQSTLFLLALTTINQNEKNISFHGRFKPLSTVFIFNILPFLMSSPPVKGEVSAILASARTDFGVMVENQQARRVAHQVVDEQKKTVWFPSETAKHFGDRLGAYWMKTASQIGEAANYFLTREPKSKTADLVRKYGLLRYHKPPEQKSEQKNENKKEDATKNKTEVSPKKGGPSSSGPG
ncbi:MAG TPA: ankyrin repeat domain-containing protein [Gammaproteobacteria bacterium]|nr:ankyrin repeat domain-containing protein [Gammaproteobacteria bacterium]